MPAISRNVIRLAMVHLLIAFTMGVWYQAAIHGALLPFFGWLRPVHVELALIGWSLHLALATAYWLLPKHPEGGNPRGRRFPALAGFIALHVGLWMVVGGLIVGDTWVVLHGRFGQLIGAALVATVLVPRVKAFGK